MPKMSSKHSLTLTTLRTLTKDRMFVAGLLMFAILAAMSIAGYIIVPEDARTNWYLNERWTLNPKLAPPCWADYLTSTSRAPTTNLSVSEVSEFWQIKAEEVWEEKYKELVRLGITDEVILENLKAKTYENFRELYQGRGLVHEFRYELAYDIPPQDMAIIIYNNGPTKIANSTVKLVRPDGVEIRFTLSQNTELQEGGSTILKFSQAKDFKERLVKDFLSSQTDLAMLRALADYVEYGIKTPLEVFFYGSFGSGGNVSLGNLVKGVYSVKVAMIFNDTVDKNNINTQLRVLGSCYGVLGTDNVGRDNLWTLLSGAGIALLIGLPYALISRIIGLLYGATSGYYGGTLVDTVMQRICEVIYAMPFLPFIILISYTLKETGTQISIWQIVGLLVIFGWPGVAIVSRSMALSVREEPYVEAAKALGASDLRIILKYIIPQLMPYFFTSVMLATPGAILTEVFLSVLGLTDPNMPSWGKMISGAQLTVHAWWWIIPPGIAITITGLTFMFLGYSIENTTNPRRRL